MPNWWPYVTLAVSTGFAVFTAARVVALRARQIVGQLRTGGEPTNVAELTTTLTFYIATVIAVTVVVCEAASGPDVDPRRAREATYLAPLICALALAAVFAGFAWCRARRSTPTASSPGRVADTIQDLIRFLRRPWPAALIALFGVYSVLATLARGLGVLLAR